MAVLSTYLTDVKGSVSPKGDSLRTTRPIMCNSDFEGSPPYLRHGAQPEVVPAIRDVPMLQPYWAAGFPLRGATSCTEYVTTAAYDCGGRDLHGYTSVDARLRPVRAAK